MPSVKKWGTDFVDYALRSGRQRNAAVTYIGGCGMNPLIGRLPYTETNTIRPAETSTRPERLVCYSSLLQQYLAFFMDREDRANCFCCPDHRRRVAMSVPSEDRGQVLFAAIKFGGGGLWCTCRTFVDCSTCNRRGSTGHLFCVIATAALELWVRVYVAIIVLYSQNAENRMSCVGSQPSRTCGMR